MTQYDITTTKKHYCYILKCSDNSLYTGYTDNLAERLKKHNAGEGAKYTKSRRPCEMVYYEQFDTKQEAMKREYYIKHKLTRQQKIELINNKTVE